MKVLLKSHDADAHSTDTGKPRLSLGIAQLEQTPPLVSQHELAAHNWRAVNREVAVTMRVDESTGSLRFIRLGQIRRRRQLRWKLWYPFSKRLQKEVADLDASIRDLSEQIFARTRTTANLDELFTELKQGHEMLSSCLHRLENQNGNKGSD